MTYNQERDELIDSHRYDSEDNLTDAAKQWNVRMQLDGADGGVRLSHQPDQRRFDTGTALSWIGNHFG